MFTGLIADLGEITDVAHSPDGVVLTVSSALSGELSEGGRVTTTKKGSELFYIEW